MDVSKVDDKKLQLQLKDFVLTAPFTINYQWKPVTTVYDVVTAGVALMYINAPYFNFSLWNKKIKTWSELKTVYGEIKAHRDIIFAFTDEELFKQVQKNWMITISGDTAMWDMNDVIEYMKAYTSEYVLDFIDDQSKLNLQLEDVLKYGLYDDKRFSELSAYWKKMLFNTNVEKQDSVQISVNDNMLLEITVDEWDDIPDELINYVEKKNWYDFDTQGLRQLIGFQPGDRQRYFLVAQKRFSWIVCSRKFGKSYLMAYLAIRQLFKKNQDIIYVVPDFTMAEQVYSYLERFIRDVWDIALRFDRARHTISYTVTRSTITFVSGESKYVGRSKKADLLIYDEASFLADIVEKTLRPLISNTMWRQVAVSTPSPTSPINRFYFGFKKWELGNRENYLSIRRDLYHNKWIPDSEKSELIDHYKNDPIMSQTELLAMFPINAGLFNTAEFFLHHTQYKDFIVNGIKLRLKDDAPQLKKEYKWFVFWYDPALLRDKWGLTIFGVREITTTLEKVVQKRHLFEIIGAAYINIVDYNHQIDVLCSCNEILQDKDHYVHIAMDYTGAGMWVYELMQNKGLKNIHRIMRTGNNQKGEPLFDNGFWKATKTDLESFFRAAMWNSVFAYNYLDEFRSELETYGTTARVDGSHFDQVSSAFCWFFICKRYLGEIVGNPMFNQQESSIEAIKSFLKNWAWDDGTNFQSTTKLEGNRHERFRRFWY